MSTPPPNESKTIESLVILRKCLAASAHDITSMQRSSEDALQQDALKQVQAALQRRQVVLRKSAAAAAAFRFEHAPELIDAIRRDPRAMSGVIDLQRDRWPDPAHLGDLITTLRVLEQYMVAGTLPLVPDFPLILSCPRTLEVGVPYALLGCRFGVGFGRLTLDVEGRPAPVELQVTQWSDSAVNFSIPSTLAGVPFGAHGRLKLERLTEIGGGQGLGSDCTASVDVLVEPISILCSSVNSYSDDGRTAWFWEDYKHEVTLKSPPLPGSCRRFAAAMLDEPGLSIWCHDNSYATGESGCNATFGALQQVDGKLQVTATIEDDWFWDYTVTANFVIETPQGIAVNPGWDVV